MSKPVKIALDDYLFELNKTQKPKRTILDVCRKYNISAPLIYQFMSQAPESVSHLYFRLKEANISVNDEFFGVVPGSAYSKAVGFLILFCRDENCELSSIVKPIKK